MIFKRPFDGQSLEWYYHLALFCAVRKAKVHKSSSDGQIKKLACQ